MTLARALNPELVLCGRCLEREDLASRWQPLRSAADDDALLVREVCVRPRCPELQVRNHLCVTHVLELELAWQGHYAVRACHGCRVSTLQLYSEHQDVWFILAASELNRQARGVEKKKPSGSVPSSPVLAPSKAKTRGGKARRVFGKRPRRSGRFRNQHIQKEQLRAWEFSMGNLPVEKAKYLWQDNQARLEMEKNPAACHAVKRPPVKSTPDVSTRPEPTEIFCAWPGGCTMFAKTGDRCRFHSLMPLVFRPPSSNSSDSISNNSGKPTTAAK